MFKYRKFEISIYIVIIALSVLFSVLLLAYGYDAWFLFAVAVVVLPCSFSLYKIMSNNALFSKIEKYYKNALFDDLEHYLPRKLKKYPFVRVFQINSYLEKGETEIYLEQYAEFKEKRMLVKTWQYKLEAYKIFYDLLSGSEVVTKNAMRLESDVDAEEVETERNLCKTLDYFFRGDYERSEKQLSWLTKEGSSRFLKFVTLYVRYLTVAVFGEGEELKQKLISDGYNEFLKKSLGFCDSRVTEICTRAVEERPNDLRNIK